MREHSSALRFPSPLRITDPPAEESAHFFVFQSASVALYPWRFYRTYYENNRNYNACRRHYHGERLGLAHHEGRRRCLRRISAFHEEATSSPRTARRGTSDPTPQGEFTRNSGNHCRRRRGRALSGVTAAYTTLPVIGVPIESKSLKGLDSLLSIVQMPQRYTGRHGRHRAPESRPPGSPDPGLSDVACRKKLVEFKEKLAVESRAKNGNLKRERRIVKP